MCFGDVNEDTAVALLSVDAPAFQLAPHARCDSTQSDGTASTEALPGVTPETNEDDSASQETHEDDNISLCSWVTDQGLWEPMPGPASSAGSSDNVKETQIPVARLCQTAWSNQQSVTRQSSNQRKFVGSTGRAKSNGMNPRMDPRMLTLGSLGHPFQCGLPCKYAGRTKGCREGRHCQCCHMCKWSRQNQHLPAWQRLQLATYQASFQVAPSHDPMATPVDMAPYGAMACNWTL
jgi:hypothetical protein